MVIVECDFENTMVSTPEFWNWLENRRGQDDKVFREVWKTVETETRKTKMVKVEGKREEVRRERAKEKIKIKRIKKIAKEWEIWNKEKKAKFEEKARKLVP